MVLYLAFQPFAVFRQYHEWDPVTSGDCYISHDTSTFSSSYLWMVGLVLYTTYITLLLVARLTSRGNLTWMNIFSDVVSKKEALYRRRYTASVDSLLQVAIRSDRHPTQGPERSRAPEPVNLDSHPRFRSVILQSSARMIALNIPLFIWWCWCQFLALWAYGDSESFVLIAALFGFVSWNTYDIVDMKLSNTSLVLDETAWGFGQVLPLALLGLILLNIMDSAQGRLFIIL